MRTLPYGAEAEQVGDLLLPDGDGPFPTVVLWHGGSFETQYTRGMLEPLARELVRRGSAVFNATYRRLGSGGGVPESFDDALAAVDVLDLPEPPVGLGFSAGAPLALHAAIEGRLSRVVVLGGVSLLEEAARAEASVLRLFGAGPDEAPELYSAYDPGKRLPLPVPSLVVHGEADDHVPLRMAEEFARRAGPTCELMTVPCAGHFDLHGADAPDELFAFLAP